MAVARYTLAVDRRFNRDAEQTADFIPCKAFGRQAEFAEKYFRKGLKIVVSGRIQTGSYVNRDNVKVYTTEVIVDDQEFAESKASSDSYQAARQSSPADPSSAFGMGQGASDVEGFMNIPEELEDGLPFA